MRRLFFILCCILYVGVTGLADAAQKDVANQASFLHACIWMIQSQTEADEYKYVVDLQKRKLVSSEHHQILNRRESDFEVRMTNRKNQSSATCLHIMESVKTRKDKSLLDTNLLKSLQKPDFMKWITPSPDGLYAIIVADDNPILLVEIKTLDTFIIGNVNKKYFYLETPVAWSPDSRLVAFAPPYSDNLYLYSIDKHAIVCTKPGIGTWPQALSWSPDIKQLAVFTYQNRRLSKSPIGLLGSMLGHPDYRNDGVLSVYWFANEQNFSIILKRGMSEMDSSETELEWK